MLRRWLHSVSCALVLLASTLASTLARSGGAPVESTAPLASTLRRWLRFVSGALVLLALLRCALLLALQAVALLSLLRDALALTVLSLVGTARAPLLLAA
jgi:hypothetical protein